MNINWSFVSYPIIQWWLLGTLLQIVCLGILIRRGMMEKHPGESLYLAVQIGLSIYMLYAGLTVKNGYYWAFRNTQWMQVSATVALMLGVFYSCVDHFRSKWKFLLYPPLMASAVGSLAVALVAAGERVRNGWVADMGAFIARHGNVSLGCTVFMLCSRAIFLTSPSTRLSVNAKRSLDLVLAFVFGTWANSVAADVVASKRLIQAITVALSMVLSVGWMTMRQSGDYRPPPDTPLGSFEAGRSEDRALLRGLWKLWKQ